MSADTVDEPLLESAPLAHRLAQSLCILSGEDCGWYHGFWQYMRVLGLAKTSGGHGPFQVQVLRGLAQGGEHGRVLVSGSADYSLPAHVAWAYRAESAPLSVIVVDRCETPLALTRWYAERTGIHIGTVRADIVDYETAGLVDVITTNSFLGYFDAAGRRRLVTGWRRLLRPGGIVVFTNRLRPDATAFVGFTSEQRRAFVDAASREAARLRDELSIGPEQAAAWAGVYAERFGSHPVRSPEEVEGLLKEGGFSIDRLEVVAAPRGGRSHLAAGPSIADGAEYVRVIATRV